MNEQFEAWLEAALEERAPDLAGGLGEPGVDPEPVEPYEPPLDVDLSQDAVAGDEMSEAEEADGVEVPSLDGEGAEDGTLPGLPAEQ